MNKKMALVLSAIMATNTLAVYPANLMANEINQEIGKEVTDVIDQEEVGEQSQITTPSAITIKSLPIKTEYKLGEELDLSGGEVEITHENDTTRVIDMTDAIVNVSGYNKEQVGMQTLEVKYEELQTSFEVEVIKEDKVAEEPILSKDKWIQCEDGRWRKIIQKPGLDFENMTEFNLDKIPKDNQFYAEKDGVITQLVKDYTYEGFKAEKEQGLYYTTVEGTDFLYKLTGLDTETEYEIRYRINRETTNGYGKYYVSKPGGGVFTSDKNVTINTGENKGIIRINEKNSQEKVDGLQFKFATGQPNQKIFIDYIEVVAVADENPDGESEIILSKDKWTQCEDNMWRKIVEQPGLDFESMPLGEYTTEKDLNKFYDGNAAGQFEIIEIAKDNYGLKFTPSRSGPNNIQYSSDVNNEYSYEVKFKYNVKGEFNTTFKSVRNGSEINGKAIDNEGIIVNSINPIYSGVGEGDFAGTLVIDKPTNGNIELKLWKGGNAQIIIDQLEMIAVSPKNPDALEVSEKKELIRNNDILKNKGDFEEWNEEKIPDFDQVTSGISKKGTIEIVDEHKYIGTHSAKITTGSELIIQLDELSANTEYSIFFVADPHGGNVEFRMSGFKNNKQYDYDNGNYNGGNWDNIPEGRANMFNWVENLKIGKDGWNTFRYDFTTGDNTENSVRARLKAVGTDAYVDEIYLVEKNKIEKISNPLPANDQLSKGHRILIDQGMQFQSWISSVQPGRGKVPTLEMIQDMGLTAAQYNNGVNFNPSLHKAADEQGVSLKWATAFGPKGSHISFDYQDDGNSPTEQEWKDGFLTEENGINYLDDLISMCIGDEENYSDTLTQNLKSWFEVIREHYPNVIVHHNEVGNSVQDNLTQISTFNEDMLRKYVQTAKPDLISYDMYYFRERRVGQTIGGTVIPFYDDLNRYRIVSSEGIDGTSEQPIPFGQYHYSWRTGPGGATPLKRGDGWYEMTESQINLYTFATWAFGGKWMSNFNWTDDSPQYLFTDYRPNEQGVYEQYYIYDQFKEMIRQSLNLGPHLTRLQVEKDVAIVAGQHLTKEGKVLDNNKPKDNVYWDNIKKDTLNRNVFISDIQVDNLGEQNNGLNGDVFISYFKPLTGLTEEDKKVFTSEDSRYFMILNGLTAGDGLPAEMQQGSAYETRQEIKVRFELPDQSYATKLKKVSRVDGGETKDNQGKVVDVALNHISGNTYEMTMVTGGGYADLFYWELGDEKDTITKQANETGKQELIEGKQKYINKIEKRDLEGRTITIGHITGTNDVAPEASLGKTINTPAEKDLYDGNVINLEINATPGGNIGAIGNRYFTQDIWEFRIDRIQKDNDVKLEFKEYDWTQDELINNIAQVKAGKEVSGMPDIIVVPDEWLWDIDGLMTNEAVLPMQDFAVIDLEERKWNDAYTQMTTKDGKTYGAFIDPSTNPTGLFVNKTLLGNVGTSSLGESGIYELQKQGKWTFAELNKIIDAAIDNDINSKGIKLFTDNQDLIRQILVSAGVNTNPYEFDATTPEYAEAISLYNKLKKNNLLLDGNLEEQMEAFSNKEVIFLVAPYEDVAQHLSGAYWYYEDNTVRKYTENFLGKWGEQTYTAPRDGEPWSVTVRNRPAGKYEMKITDWNFMLFPKLVNEDDYRAIINNVSYPVMLASTNNPDDVAFIWNEIAEEYKGIDNTAMERGGIERPNGRTWEPKQGDNARDYHALKTVELRAGQGDNLKASGVWDAVLYDLIQKAPNDYEAINKAVADYVGETDESEKPEKPEEVDKTILNKLIKEADDKDDDDYTKTSWREFEKQLDKAEKVSKNKKATQEQVNDAINNLTKAMNGLVSIHGNVDKSKLNELIKEADDKDDDDYTKTSWREFEKQLDKAEKVSKDKKATQKQVNDAINNLTKAMNGLVSIHGSVDKSKLNELIKEANRKDDDDYTKTSWREFKKQLDKAEKVSKDKKATQEQIDKAIEELNKAIKELVEKRK